MIRPMRDAFWTTARVMLDDRRRLILAAREIERAAVNQTADAVQVARDAIARIKEIVQ